eukprot:3786894-Prymnesium_polylepis.1
MGSLIVVPVGSSILRVQLRRHLPGIPPPNLWDGSSSRDSVALRRLLSQLRMSSFTVEDILKEAATSRASRDDMVLNTDVATVLYAVNSPSGSSLRQLLLGGRARSRSPRGPSSGSGRPSS